MQQTLNATEATRNEVASGHEPETEANNALVRFLDDSKGTASLEYGLIAAGIAIALLAGVQSIGAELTDMYSTIITGLHSLY